jgi:tRNA(His) 5'-end guanylyltransferase
MKLSDLEGRMRSLEYFHSLRLLPEVWAVLRVDGRSFSRLTADRFEKPFDVRFHGYMVRTAEALLTELQSIYAYTESDEISLLFRPEWDLFDRELEKLVSVSAGIASSTFSLAAGVAVHFDSRVWLGATPELVVDYFRWRQTDAARCALNGWCYWTLRQGGLGEREATSELLGLSVADKNELLFRHGVNFNDLPVWQKRGVGLYWEEYQKEGFNPKMGVSVWATRRRIKVDEELPKGDEYAPFLRRLMAA